MAFRSRNTNKVSRVFFFRSNPYRSSWYSLEPSKGRSPLLSAVHFASGRGWYRHQPIFLQRFYLKWFFHYFLLSPNWMSRQTGNMPFIGIKNPSQIFCKHYRNMKDTAASLQKVRIRRQRNYRRRNFISHSFLFFLERLTYDTRTNKPQKWPHGLHYTGGI